jgi:hypothetical protein
MNSVETGDAFRDLVADLLRTQYQNVQVEQWINGTKVDVTFSQEDFGNLINFAVECKDYSTPLTKSYISEKIWTKYEPILQSGKIDRVLVVSRKSLGAAASAFVDGWRGASHQTYEEFAESLIGFKRYLQTLGALKPTDETPYVEARIEGRDQGAITVVDDWVACADSPAVAILGGYGQGKTSFAKRIAAEYAQRYLRDPTHRLPILLRLGEVVHETQLEGLFGKEFTARHHIKGYNFHALEHLNRLGRLLILLDGFDEMKHAMTAADFMANFLEFNRLLVPNAKVMLLGRPNALPSEERELVFRGKAKVGDSHVASAAFNRWDEWRLAFFSLGETEQLLAAHLSMLVKKYAGSNRYQYPADFIAKRVAEIIRKVPSDLLRPSPCRTDR